MVWHIIPIEDSMEHETSLECDCAPVAEVQEDGDVYVIHNACDGRTEDDNELVPEYEDIAVETTLMKRCLLQRGVGVKIPSLF